MKTKFLSLVLLFTLVLALLVSCGTRLSGTYKTAEFMGSYTSYTFSGSKVTVKVYAAEALVTEAEGKYEIDGEEITFVFEGDKGKEYDGTFKFIEEDGELKIGSLLVLTKEK